MSKLQWAITLISIRLPFVGYIIGHEIFHFVFSGSLGLLGYWLTSTILDASVHTFGLEDGNDFLARNVRHFIHIISFLVGLALAFWGHSFLDLLWDGSINEPLEV